MDRKSMNTALEFRNELKRLREEKGFKTQRELSIASDVKQKDISKYELGQAFPRLTNLRKLGDTLGTDLTYFLTNNKKTKTSKTNFKSTNKNIEGAKKQEIRNEGFITEEVIHSNKDLINTKAASINISSIETSLDTLTHIVKEVNISWLKEKISPLMEPYYNKEICVHDTKETFLFNSEFAFIQTNYNFINHLFYTMLGAPSIKIINSLDKTERTIWFNYQLTELRQAMLISKLLKPQSTIHYYNTKLGWLVAELNTND
ncbi:helix-turn-helix transcriptional regulator [Alkalihalophilus pseudofirmus]|uniref:Helix-turn-helix transcriptional regulator n=1 Tax=Alkalihalophilus pseudofirmus TaxID=79885 RepID=A0AAJ2NPT0_ALKPS|nr:helix-turn-helix transcriptional regulator [Alkalihalophilus pseudofirmus]MDV2886370.1 helix-turn-helix transcriptional regulator [Alkalihalophilus pseudofirmus]